MISTVLQQCSGSDTVEMVNAGLLLAAGRRGLIRQAAFRVNLLMADRDTRNAALSGWDGKSLVKLSKEIRKDFNALNAKFVCASSGETKKDGTVAGGETFDAMQAVDGKSRKYADFIGKNFDNHVATRCSRGLSALAETASNDSTRPTRFLESHRRDKPASGNPSD